MQHQSQRYNGRDRLPEDKTALQPKGERDEISLRGCTMKGLARARATMSNELDRKWVK